MGLIDILYNKEVIDTWSVSKIIFGKIPNITVGISNEIKR
jgi:hypothetical protein